VATVASISTSKDTSLPTISHRSFLRLTSWLDNWLDPDSFQGRVTIQFRETDSEGFELRWGDEETNSQTILLPTDPVAGQTGLP
jgi:hypothetical protein